MPSKMKIGNLLNKFRFVKVLNDNSQSKLIFVHAIELEQTQANAVIIFEKPHFSEAEVSSIIDSSYSTRTHIANDIYKKLSVYPTEPYNNVEVQLIYPATDAHIVKYTAQEMFRIDETYDDYVKLTLPSLESSLNINWVYNILEHKKEQERIVFEDSDDQKGFILLPDIKWDGISTESLYLLAIVHQRGLKSLRDLNDDHLLLLENIRDKSLKIIKEKYNLDSTKIRAHFHYQPSFYHLHIHFTHIKHTTIGIECDRAHSLNTVIDNLKNYPNYYQKATMTFLIRKNEKLFEPYRSKMNF